jgi:hypothetical protein
MNLIKSCRENFHQSSSDDYEHATVSYLDANGIPVRGMCAHVTRKPEDQIKASHPKSSFFPALTDGLVQSDLTKPTNKPS